MSTEGIYLIADLEVTCRQKGTRPRHCLRAFVPTLVVLAALVSSCADGDPDPGAAALPPGGYPDSLAAVQARRASLWQRYQRASGVEREDAITRAQELMRQSVAGSLVPFWYGTSWDFNGTSETPGEGAIACGYFVTTVLRDIGFELERVTLAQQPSEVMIKSLVRAEHIKRYSDAPIAAFVDSVRKWRTGLYVVGLDCHVGFIVCDGDDVRFLHSSYAAPLCVVSENADESRILGASRYRVLGKLTGDPELARKWMAGEFIPTLKT